MIVGSIPDATQSLTEAPRRLLHQTAPPLHPTHAEHAPPANRTPCKLSPGAVAYRALTPQQLALMVVSGHTHNKEWSAKKLVLLCRTQLVAKPMKLTQLVAKPMKLLQRQAILLQPPCLFGLSRPQCVMTTLLTSKAARL